MSSREEKGREVMTSVLISGPIRLFLLGFYQKYLSASRSPSHQRPVKVNGQIGSYRAACRREIRVRILTFLGIGAFVVGNVNERVEQSLLIVELFRM